MPKPQIVSQQEWKKARVTLLEKEKAFLRQRDELSEARQALPWVKLDKAYTLRGPHGEYSLHELFGQHSQLIVYHFMMGEQWKEGCPSCSLWADSFDGNDAHFAARDAAFVVVSSAAPNVLEQYKLRMGWSFDWYSSIDSDSTPTSTLVSRLSKSRTVNVSTTIKKPIARWRNCRVSVCSLKTHPTQCSTPTLPMHVAWIT